MRTLNLKKKSSLALGALLGVAIMGTSALAGTSLTSYSVSVPKKNGSGYSGTQTKVTSGANARAVSSSTEGYSVDVRQLKDDKSAKGDWYRNLKGVMDTGYNIDGHKDQLNKSIVKLEFSNDLLTSKDITVKGQWESQ